MSGECGTLPELNVNPGDVVECVVESYHTSLGERYVINANGDIEDYGKGKTGLSKFRIVSRAPRDDSPKLWRDMSPEEKGALLLARHEGKTIEYAHPDEDLLWFSITDPSWHNEVLYRVRPPEPKVETVTLQGRNAGSGWYFADVRELDKPYQTHRITFDLIDGKPDPASIKMEHING